jgi:hypothetical protein
MKKVLVVLLAVTGGILLAHADEAVSIADKLSLELEFNASVFSADSNGVVDSMTDAGFNEDAAQIALSYEDELWGGTASLKFGQETLRIFSGEIAGMMGGNPLSIGDLFVWIKPFGEHFKFTGGIFENTSGLADYTDDIDNFGMGVFFSGENGEPFTEPDEVTNTALVNGLLTDLIFGPLTVQFLLAPNYSAESASVLASDVLSSLSGSAVTLTANERFFRIGGRVIYGIEGIGTVSAMVKTFQYPIEIIDVVEQNTFPGSKVNFTTFGAYFDLTAVENLGVSLGYTGFVPLNDSSDVDNILWSGIDLRATWTGIEGLSISTHNNFSFASGAEKDWLGLLTDGAFITLYNAIGATKELSEKFSVNAEAGNVFSKTDDGNSGAWEFENIWARATFIARAGEHAEFSAGLRVDFAKTTLSGRFGDGDESLTVFSIPVGIKVSF